MSELAIDPEFESLLPVTTQHDDEMFETNLIAAGGPDESVKVWREGGNVIVDGHRRYKVCRKHGLMFDVEELSFPDRESVKEWMLLRQRSRRNLSDIDRAIIDAELVKIEQAKGDNKRGAITRVAEQTNQSVSTVSRAVKAAKVIENLPKAARDKIKTGEVVAGAESVAKLAKLPEKQQAKAASKIAKGKVASVSEAISDTCKASAPKPKVMRADAPLPESFVDDFGNPVPESLFPIWRKKGKFIELANDLRRVAAEIETLGQAVGCEGTERLGKECEDLRLALAGMTPAWVKGGHWFSRSFAETHKGGNGG